MVESVNEAYDIKFVDGKLFISLDSNKDGQPILELKVDLFEVSDEILDFFKKD